MKQQDFNVRTKIIKEQFIDPRPIKCSVNKDELELDDHIHQEGDLFLTEDCEYIYLELQMDDFTESELAKYVELAEELYEKSKKTVSMYLICPKDVDVYVNEFDIPSDADFTIKLYCVENEICEIILDSMKNKMKTERLTQEDRDLLMMLPQKCRKEKKRYYFEEVFKIINRYHY